MNHFGPLQLRLNLNWRAEGPRSDSNRSIGMGPLFSLYHPGCDLNQLTRFDGCWGWWRSPWDRSDVDFPRRIVAGGRPADTSGATGAAGYTPHLSSSKTAPRYVNDIWPGRREMFVPWDSISQPPTRWVALFQQYLCSVCQNCHLFTLH